MSKMICIDGCEFELSEAEYNAPATILDPILLNQYPFVHEGMSVGEYFEEKKYYGENYEKVLKGEYVPLWKQKSNIE